jgi:predicted esterase
VTAPGAGERGLLRLDGTLPFVREVPWRLHLPAGPGVPVPLLVALHGKTDTAARFEAEALGALPPGWGLLVPSGPIPRDHQGPAGRQGIGDAWYLYDGDTPAFRESLDRAEAFLVELLLRVRRAAGESRPIDPSRAWLLGFSQGGYLAGMAAVRRPEEFRGAVLVGARLKVEALGGHLPAAAAAGTAVLALHGSRDLLVAADRQRESVAAARAAGLDATMEEFDAAHAFPPPMRDAARAWLATRDGGGPGNRTGSGGGGRAPRGESP